MKGRVHLLWYHSRLAFSWAALLPPLALAGTVAALTLVAPHGERPRDLSIAVEGGLPLVAALLAAPLLIGERDRRTLPWLAVRTSLLGILSLRLTLLGVYLAVCGGLTLLVAGLLWHGPAPWDTLGYAGAPALAFSALALLAASWSGRTVEGYLAPTALWLGVLMFGSLLPQQEPWLTLNPFAASAGFDALVVAHSKLFYLALGLVLLLPQWVLLRRPEHLLR